MTRLVNIVNNEISEFWEFPEEIPDEDIIELYKEYQSSEHISFETFLEEEYPNIEAYEHEFDEIWLE